MRRQQGFTLLEVFLVCIIAAIVSVLLLVRSPGVQDMRETQTITKLLTLCDATARYVRDTCTPTGGAPAGTLPGGLPAGFGIDSLETNAPAVAGWKGPYVVSNYSCAEDDDARRDAYGRALVTATSASTAWIPGPPLAVGSALTRFTITSRGVDGVPGNDDLVQTCDVTPVLRSCGDAIVQRDLAALRGAFRKYNAVFQVHVSPGFAGGPTWTGVMSTDQGPNLINIYTPGGPNTSLVNVGVLPAGWTFQILTPGWMQLRNATLGFPGQDFNFTLFFSGVDPGPNTFTVSFQFIHWNNTLNTFIDGTKTGNRGGNPFAGNDPAQYAGPVPFDPPQPPGSGGFGPAYPRPPVNANVPQPPPGVLENVPPLKISVAAENLSLAAGVGLNLVNQGLYPQIRDRTGALQNVPTTDPYGSPYVISGHGLVARVRSVNAPWF